MEFIQPIEALTDEDGSNLRTEQDRSHVMASPRILPIYLGMEYGDPSGLNARGLRLQEFFEAICNSSYFDLLGEYGVTDRPLMLPHVWMNDDGAQKTMVRTTFRDDYADFLAKAMAQNNLMAPADNESNLLYVLFLPPNIAIELDSGAAPAFHSYNWHKKIWPWPPNLFYAAIGFQDAISIFTCNITHELVEAFTDRDGWGWRDGDMVHEIGDLCPGGRGMLEFGNYRVSSFWSKSRGGCIQQADLPANDPLVAVTMSPEAFSFGTPIRYSVNTLDRFRGMPVEGWAQVYHYVGQTPHPCGARFAVPGTSAPITIPPPTLGDPRHGYLGERAPYLLVMPDTPGLWNQVQLAIPDDFQARFPVVD